MGGRRAWHFPQTPGGEYAGHYPGDADEAIAHLEELRERGAEYLLIPGTSLWWLEHYAEFRHHLEQRYERLAEAPDSYLVFSLGAATQEAAA